MLKDITLGQCFPGKSPVHLLDPRTKLIMLVVYIVALFAASSWLSYGLLLAFLVAVVKLSTIPPKSILKGMKPLVMILVFTGVLNLFFTTGEGKPLVDFWFITIYKEGLIRAIFMVVRILMLISCTFLLTYTTSPIALTDGLEALMNPLKKLKVPVHELAMMMCIALRFIPTLIEETEKIMNAQKARGADFSSGGLVKRARAIVPIIIPLFVSAFRRAGDLASAMECRCYTGGKGRTRMNVLRARPRDFAAAAAVIAIGAAVICINLYAPGYSIKM
jgi:energy-coupling factor transport system permease protein